ncbi:DUF5693 family protein [Acetohalobium arabaticum]|uniref:Uncharacterized protein n=1 Tax=Acetohalobium arabaticum (strain ATCC 49924 / DSM 5501 / Z-7288) TaxID=574087 RepID=D9QU35_ACEAZ|nr:DUF5693 family protein [Acetohalobium arabaticum]ADL11828.1 conserved hypothetical protein [Acetohalobium arabaticum DSM 5501]
MYKKVLIILIIAGMITGAVIGYQRYQVETGNRSVELILDLKQWQKLKLPPGVDLAALLEKYESQGVTSLAIIEQDLGDLEASGKVKLVTDLELRLLKETVGNNFQQMTSIFCRTPQLKQKIEERLSSYLGDNKVVTADRKLLAAEADQQQLVDFPIGFTAEQLDLARRSGLKVVPRFGNQAVDDSKAIKDRFSELNTLPQAALSQVIFSGTEVLGYPDYLSATAALIEEYDLQLGIIEPFIAEQTGVNRLANNLGPNNIRVHSADQQEFNLLPVEKLVDRYLRAVRERNVRGVYLKPILESKDGRSAVELTNQLVADLTAGLQAEGYSLAPAEPISDFSSSLLFLFIINLAAVAALFYLVEYLFISEFPLVVAGRYKLILFLISALVSLVLISQDYIFLTRELTALLVAIIFPTLAVVSTLFPYIFSNQEIENRIKALFNIFVRVSLITLSGGVLLVGALGSWHYMVKLRQFRGVKLSFIGPILLVIAYYLHYRFWLNREDYSFQALIDKANSLLNKNLKLKDLFLLIFLAVVGIIYIGRTGNQPLIPVPELELIIRDWLEQLLSVRPRFKSFLIGHPLLVMATWLIITGNRDWSIPVLLGGLVGQITVMNTFSHIHTPLWTSGVRVGLGLMLGFVIGILLVKLGRGLLIWKQKLRKELD